MSSNILHSLEVSRTVRSFDPAHRVDINPLLKAIQLTPTAWGIQPFKIHVVTNSSAKEQLSKCAGGQRQVSVKVYEYRFPVYFVLALCR